METKHGTLFLISNLNATTHLLYSKIKMKNKTLLIILDATQAFLHTFLKQADDNQRPPATYLSHYTHHNNHRNL